jgi:hypothetical protein
MLGREDYGKSGGSVEFRPGWWMNRHGRGLLRKKKNLRVTLSYNTCSRVSYFPKGHKPRSVARKGFYSNPRMLMNILESGTKLHSRGQALVLVNSTIPTPETLWKSRISITPRSQNPERKSPQEANTMGESKGKKRVALRLCARNTGIPEHL